jgi:hypothetical protein
MRDALVVDFSLDQADFFAPALASADPANNQRLEKVEQEDDGEPTFH